MKPTTIKHIGFSILFGLACYSCYNHIISPFGSLLIGGNNIRNAFTALKIPERAGSYNTPKDAINAGWTIATYGQFICELFRLLAIAIILILSINFYGFLERRSAKS